MLIIGKKQVYLSLPAGLHHRCGSAENVHEILVSTLSVVFRVLNYIWPSTRSVSIPITIWMAVVSLLVAGSKSVFAQNLLSGPESIVFDSIYDRYLVSNMNYPYYITAIDHDGSYSVFHYGLHWPHGITIVDSILYVTSNVGTQGGIVGLSLHTGEKVYQHTASNWYKAVYSNITADTSGNLYFGVYSRIYRLNLATDQGYMLPYYFNIPNGIHFDAKNNRVLIPCEVWESTIYAINVADFSLDAISVDHGRYSCITEDQTGNFYISAFWENEIFRFDNNLANRELLADGFNGPEAIYLNRSHSTLAVPNLLANRIDFIPLDIDVWSTPDDTVGWIPFAVSFEGFSIYEITGWYWDFGDGSVSTSQTPVHLYDTPGLYDVTLQAITAEADTLTRTYPRHIFALADTFRVDSLTTYLEEDLEFTIDARITVPFREIQIPVDYSGDLNLVFDSFSTAGCFTDGFGGKQVIDDNPGEKHIMFSLRPRESGSPLYASPDSGPVLKLYFHTIDAVRNQRTELDLAGYSIDYMPSIAANGAQYNPTVHNGSLEFLYVCGDANTDETVNAGDIVYLINYVFRAGPPPVPLLAGDADCDGNANVGDAVYLVNLVFKGGPEPCCP